MSDNDFREVIDGEENKEPAASDNNLHTTEAESAEVVNTTADARESDEKKDDEYEEICYICHRPEHIAGKMIRIPNSISICHDCMQRTFDSMNGTGFPMGDMMKYAAIVISTAPIMMLYPFVQKYFNQGVMIGALKE